MTGAYADEERIVPELAVRNEEGELEEAQLDLVTSWPGMSSSFYIDVTLRSPHASRYTHSAIDALEPLAHAEAEKHIRYGRGVLPLAISPYGRMGEESRAALEMLAKHAVAWGKPSFRFLKPGVLAGRSRSALERVAIWQSVDVQLLALGRDARELAMRRRVAGAAGRMAAVGGA